MINWVNICIIVGDLYTQYESYDKAIKYYDFGIKLNKLAYNLYFKKGILNLY